MSTGKAKPGVLKVPGALPAAANRSKLASQASQSRLINASKADRSLTVGVASRTTLTSSSRKSQLALDSKTEQRFGGKINSMIQVFDESGADVTPQPLLIIDPNAVKHNQSKIFGSGGDSSGGTPTDLMSQASIYQTGNASFAGPFTRSVFGTSMTQSSRSAESFTDDFAEPAAAADIVTGLGDVQTERQIEKEVLTEEDLDKAVSIQLTETDTIWMLDLPAICLSAESDEATKVKERNEKYKELCKSRDGNDRYAERGMQTFNEQPKNKDVQTMKVNHNDSGITATTWDMYDTYEEIQDKIKKAEEDDIIPEEASEDRPLSTAASTASVAEQRKRAPTGAKDGDSRGSLMASSVADSETDAEVKKDGTVSAEGGVVVADTAILQSDALKTDLFVMERVVTLNNFQPKQASYRTLPILPDIDKIVEEEPAEGSSTSGAVNIAQLGPNLDRLWAYTCSLTKGRNVSSMSWNKLNKDLLAIGYGQFGFTEQKGGLACCWSLKNPEFPERVFHCESGVTAMDFSATNPNLLAIGMYNGMVAIYNVRGSNDTPVLDSYESHGKHSAPVWQLKWIDKEKGGSSGEERGELLISVSTDGRVTQWQIRKGFECADLMKLKRVAKASKKQKEGKETKSEGFISRQASGMCFDFNPKDLNIYLAGTEEGHIHKCSCSYNEQYLDSYFGHTGPVYRIEWSPFLPDVFISASSDWSIRLWVQDRQKPVLNFFSSTKAVMDVSWSPTSATVFGCVNEGAVEIWDLSTNMLDPIIVNVPAPGVKLSCLKFALNSNCILVGDSDGQVSVYQLRNMPPVEDNQREKLEDLIRQTLDSELTSKR
ncbi:dynein intermediate chain 4, axonemal-like [Patiria miniata]|uniref:Dynein axonemal intermediate chain 4 n=1 Tax=Patiria miniata TaxID=46514 RepID=A0A914AX15_PATMI|nr:dynein intermediate chain 4, axonemal-like [Patiria miniata]